MHRILLHFGIKALLPSAHEGHSVKEVLRENIEQKLALHRNF